MTTPVYGLDDEQLKKQCEIKKHLSSGPGGQHAQKNATAVALVHSETGVEVQASQERSAQRNLQHALRRLRIRLALQVRGQGTPDAIEQQRRGRQLPVRAQAASFPLLLGYALDVFEMQAGSLGDTARALGISTSQLIKFLAADKEVQQTVNSRLQQRGKSVMRMS